SSMLGRWLFIGVIALGVFAYMHAHHSAASRTDVTQACAPVHAPGRASTPENVAPAGGIAVVAAITWSAANGGEDTWLEVSTTKEFPDGLTASHGPLP